MAQPPFWALSVVYWLHMLATVVWIGGLAALALIVLPAARQALQPPEYANLLASLQRRLEPVGWFSLVLLVGTGMVQMSANPNYQGFLAVHNRWAVAILVKHLVFFGMVLVSAYLTWGLLPGLRRMALRQALHFGEEAGQEMVHLQWQEIWLLRLNLVLGLLVLALTALARVSS